MGHNKSVNCLRFEPTTGKVLASASDDGKIMLWIKRFRVKSFGSSEQIFAWGQHKMLFGHTKEVYDLKWFNQGKNLVSGGHDFSMIIWDVATGRPIIRYWF